MSSNKKIRNRLDKLFTDIQQTEREETTPESPVVKQVPEPVTTARAKRPAPLPVEAPVSVTMAEAVTDSETTLISIPFQVASEWNVLQLETDAGQEWQEAEQSLVSQVVDQLGLALQNAQLFQQTEEQNKSLQVLNEMGRELTSLRSVPEIAKSLHKYTSQLMNGENFFVALLGQEQNTMEVIHLVIEGQQYPPQTATVSGMTGWVFKNKTSLLMNGDINSQVAELGIEKILIKREDHAETWEPASWLGVPLLLGEEVLGAIVVQSRTKELAYRERERDLLTAIASQAAIAVQNANLFQQTEEQNTELAVLNEMAREISSLLSVKDVAQTLYKYAGRLMDVSDFFVGLYHPDSDEMSFPAIYFDRKPSEIERTSVGNGMTAWVIRQREALFFPDRVKERADALGIEILAIGDDTIPECWLGVPLVLGQKVLGAIVVQNAKTPHAYTERHKNILMSMASQVSIAIQNANLFQQTEEQNRSLQVLNEMGRELVALLRIDQILESVHKYASQLVNTRTLILTLYNEENHTVEYPLAIEEGKSIHIETRPVGNTLSDYVISNRQVLLLNGDIVELAKAHGITVRRVGNQKPAVSWLGVPLLLGEKALGAIIVQSTEAINTYGERERDLLTAVASQTAIAIQNARLFDETQKRAAELAGLNDILRTASAEIDLQKIIEATHEKMQSLLPMDAFILALYDDKNETLDYKLMVDEGIRYDLPPSKLSQSLMSETVRSKKHHLLLRTPEEIKEQETLNIAVGNTSKLSASLIYVPMLKGSDVIGVISIQSYQYKAYTQSDVNLLENVANQLANVIQNAFLYENIQKSLNNLALINRLTSTVSSSLEIQSSLQVIAEEFQKTFNVGHVGIALFDQNYTTLTLTADAPLPTHGKSDIGIVIPVAGSLATEQVLATKKPVFVYDVANNPLTVNIKDVMGRRGTKNMMIFPLLSGNEVVGTVGFDTFDLERAFTEDEIQLVETILFQVASSIRNAQLFLQTQSSEERLRRQNEYLATATEVSRLITSTLDMDVLFNRAVDLIRSRFNYYFVGLFTVDENSYNALLREGTGIAGEEMKHRQFSLAVGSKSVIGSVTGTGSTLVVNNTALDPIYRPHPLLPDTRSQIGIPLKIGARVIGALDIHSDEINTFHPEEIAVLETLADQISVALDNARSYDMAQKAVEEMRELDTIKSQFLANMSHELRTPLNSIIGFSRVILKGIDGPITEPQQQDLSAIYSSGQHLLGLINNILDLSKIEAGKMELTIEELNIADAISNVISTSAGLVKDKPIKLVQEIETGLPTVRADPMRLRQIMLNLISNAAKFTEEGSITISANLHRASTGASEVLVSVTDTGPGIAPEDQKKLFQAFSQVDSSATRKTGGTGLGLSICKRMVEMHGGKIGVHSAPGKGSTFYFTVPLFNAQLTPPQEGERTILCIDDDAQIVSLYERYLKPQGFNVIGATHAAAAKDIARRIKPYAITLDIMMPEVDGWSVLKELKADPETRNIPVIVCSIVEEEEKGFSLGAADYLVKPISEEDLLGSLHMLNGDGSIKEVLVIDDSADDLRLMEKIITEHSSYHVLLAEGGEKGWEMILDNHPSAVILDLFMPGLNGFTILERLRTSPELRDLPVIVVSGAELDASQQRQLDNLGKSLLQKGMLKEDELFATLEKALKRLETNQ